jgi:hypothetical protein
MADDVVLSPGVVAATDDVGGRHFSRVKLDLGADGVSTPVVGALPVSQPGLPAALGQAAMADSTPVVLASDQTAVPVSVPGTTVIAKALGNTGAITATMAVVAGKTNYVTGFHASGSGATAEALLNLDLGGVFATGLFYTTTCPAGATKSWSIDVQFTRPIPALAAATAITLYVPAPGAGATIVSATLFGFYL